MSGLTGRSTMVSGRLGRCTGKAFALGTTGNVTLENILKTKNMVTEYFLEATEGDMKAIG